MSYASKAISIFPKAGHLASRDGLKKKLPPRSMELLNRMLGQHCRDHSFNPANCSACKAIYDEMREHE